MPHSYNLYTPPNVDLREGRGAEGAACASHIMQNVHDIRYILQTTCEVGK